MTNNIYIQSVSPSAKKQKHYIVMEERTKEIKQRERAKENRMKKNIIDEENEIIYEANKRALEIDEENKRALEIDEENKRALEIYDEENEIINEAKKRALEIEIEIENAIQSEINRKRKNIGMLDIIKKEERKKLSVLNKIELNKIELHNVKPKENEQDNNLYKNEKAWKFLTEKLKIMQKQIKKINYDYDDVSIKSKEKRIQEIKILTLFWVKIINKIIDDKDIILDGHDPFISEFVPDTSIENYVIRIIKFFEIDDNNIINLIIYFDRIITNLKHYKNKNLNLLNFYNIFGITALITRKYCNDYNYSNCRYAKVIGTTLITTNKMEIEVLSLLKFNLYVSDSEYKMYVSNMPIKLQQLLSTVSQDTTTI